jgi:EmrB/QacA subfamily drug resistance transporter
MVLLAAAGATFLAFLDVTVVNVAFPALSADFADSSLADLSWVITGYGVLFAALLTPAGRLADVTGRRRLFAMSMVGFIVASILVASSPSLPLLIAARVLQGGAAAGMIPAALGLVLAATPPSRRTVAVGLWAGAGSLAAAAGPSLGGLLIELSNWRAVFLINVPIGLGIVALSYRHIAKDVPSGRRLPDALGTAMVAIGIALVVLGLTQGSDWGWSHPSTLSCLVGGVLLLLLALWKSARHPAPAVEIDLWRRSRTFAAANVGSLLFGMAMFAWLLLGPLYLVLVWDYSILRAGLAISPGACTAAVAAVVVGRRAVGRGQQAAMIVGALLFAGSAGWFYTQLGTEPRYLALFLPANLISGIGIGAAITALSSAAATSLPPERFAAGTGLVITARQLGGALGIAAMAAILTERQAQGADALLEVAIFCGIVGAVAAVSGLALTERRAGIRADADLPPAARVVERESSADRG